MRFCLLLLLTNSVCVDVLLLHVSLPAEPILLDGLLQAVTLKSGDVVAVRTAARPLPTYFGCFDHQMQLNPKNIHRPVLAAVVQVRCAAVVCVMEECGPHSGLVCVPHHTEHPATGRLSQMHTNTYTHSPLQPCTLAFLVPPMDDSSPRLCMQAAYGVADSSLYWSQATGKGWNFVWGVGQTPFGVLSNMHSLSFVQRDAAVRNMALSYLNSSINHAALLIEGYQYMAPFDGGEQHVKAFLRPDQVSWVCGAAATQQSEVWGSPSWVCGAAGIQQSEVWVGTQHQVLAGAAFTGGWQWFGA